MGKFDALAKALGLAIEKYGDDAVKILEKVDSDKLAVSLKGTERKEYINALDEVYGPKALRESKFYKTQDYRDSSTAPHFESDAASPIYNLTEKGSFPKDIYSSQAARLYGHGDPLMDKESLKIINSVKDNPEKEIIIYRAVPKNVDYINPGDWVSINKQYAINHGEARLGENYKILEQKVKAKDVYNSGDIHEFGYSPNVKTRLPEAAFDPRFKDSPLLMAGALAAPASQFDVSDEMNPLKMAQPYVAGYEEKKKQFADALARQLNISGAAPEIEKPISSIAQIAGDPLNYIPGGAAIGLLQAGAEMSPKSAEMEAIERAKLKQSK